MAILPRLLCPHYAKTLRRRAYEEKDRDNGFSVEKRENLWYSIASNNLLYFYNLMKGLKL